MSKSWPTIRIGNVVRHRKEFITIDNLTSYKRPRVKLHANGIVLRDEVSGASIKTKTQQVCRAGEFLVAEIDAKVGGFGIVPQQLDGSIVSSHYFLYVIDESKIDRRFLDYYIRTHAFRAQVEAQGSTNYAAIRPGQVLEYKIPLPPLTEQIRVVVQIEKLATQIHDAHTVRSDVQQDIRQMLLGSFWKITATAPRFVLRDIAPLLRRPADVDPETLYPELGIRSFGKGTFHKPALSGFELGGKRIFKIEPGDLLFSNVFAWEGAIAVAKHEDSGRYGSHRFITCRPIENVATSRYLCFYFLTDEGLDLIRAASPGGAGRNRTLGLDALAAIEVPIPPLDKQLWFDALQEKVDMLKRLQDETTTEINALLPSILDRAFSGDL